MDTLKLNKTPRNTQNNLVQAGSVKAIRIPDFLAKPERDALYKAVCDEQETFATFGPPGTKKGPALFLALGPGVESNPKAVQIEEATKTLLHRIKLELPALCEQLNIQAFEVSEIPITLVNGRDGHYGDVHADTVDGKYKISILYYFNKTPKAFEGGDLNFHETTPNGYSKEVLFNIEVQDNLLVAFPSTSYHGVTQVKMDSPDLVDGRFVVVGFL